MNMKKIVPAAILIGLASQVFAADWAPSNIKDTFLNRATLQAVKAPAARLASCAEDSCGGGRIAGAPTYKEAKVFFDAAQMPSPEKLAGTRWGAIEITAGDGALNFKRYNNGDYIFQDELDRLTPLYDFLAFSQHIDPLTGEKSLGVREAHDRCWLNGVCAPAAERTPATAVVIDAKKNVLCYRLNPDTAILCRINETKGLLVCRQSSFGTRPFIIYKKISN